MRLKFALTVAVTVLLPLLLIWGGSGLWGTVGATWCGSSCLDYAISGAAIALAAAAISGAVAGAWSWIRFSTIQSLSLLTIGLSCAVALLPVLFTSTGIRAILAERYFPYVISLRFGYTGGFLLWVVLSLVVFGAVILIAGRWSNLSTRWSGP